MNKSKPNIFIEKGDKGKGGCLFFFFPMERGDGDIVDSTIKFFKLEEKKSNSLSDTKFFKLHIL